MHESFLEYEFHVARAVRERCRFDETLFASSGHAVLARPEAAQRFAAALRTCSPAHAKASASDLFALGLLDEAAHLVIAHWRRTREPHAFRDARVRLESRLPAGPVRTLLVRFVEGFPPAAVRSGALAAERWLAGATADRPHAEVALEELLLLSLADTNPAAVAYHELFDAAPLAATAPYAAAIAELEAFLATRAPVGASGQPLVEFLRGPMRASPHSLAGQLEFIAREWREFIGDLVERLELAFQLRREEERWLAARGAGPLAAEAEPPDYSLLEGDVERFSADAEWMPRTVMIAKSTLVWLDQLARRYRREVARLDQVPDEELDRLAAFGINALWLIGIWERSEASRRIKQLAGNMDAAASAYAVHDYAIAGGLGGEEAWERLRERAGARGIRLASDMVPNHMGLDSRWVIEHPERFLSRPDSPYPSYRFDGPELSGDVRVSLRIEDHYWDRSDAAVVFRRQDQASGETRYIYHGNDGTGFPWNDTAQLDHLNAATREALVQAILGVARRSPIIRFDAAMTLARRHIQRLWFPEPGSGGGIPSRSDHGMSRARFERAMPVEFWREVVDRVQAEAPGTLLLAEAFWLMEGYFVRTLGMHRVYNSAFMVMLRDERNADFRRVLRDTLTFDPRVLQRWVNYLNNPDERTAVDQFGRGEKYFGVCTLMVTLPGLPMFGHGQVEGFEERYGMEFRRAQRDEPVDEGLEREHWRRIVPLLKRRGLFAGAREFLLYDCRDASGHVLEDVLAWSNRDASGAALVLYHNRYAETRGVIRWSAARAEIAANGARSERQHTLLEGLGLAHLPEDALVRCRDAVREREHLLRVWELREHGLRVELEAFGSRVLLDWREAPRDGRPWDELARGMPAEGVPDLERALWALAVRPAQGRVEAGVARLAGPADTDAGALLETFDALLAEASARLSWPVADGDGARARLARRAQRLAATTAGDPGTPAERAAHAAWLLLEGAGAAFERAPDATPGLRLFDELWLREPIARGLRAQGADEPLSWRLAARVRALLAHPRIVAGPGPSDEWRAFLADDDARFAAGLTSAAPEREAPDWLALPGRLASEESAEAR